MYPALQNIHTTTIGTERPPRMTSRNARNIPATLSSQLKNNKWFSARIPEDIVNAAPSDPETGCIACGAVYDDEYLAHVCPNSQHTWCINCVIRAFDTALADITIFPAYCFGCGQDHARHALNIHSVKHLLPANDVQKYADRMVEYEADDKSWCFDCNAFLHKKTHFSSYSGPIITHEWAICDNCDAHTCLSCNRELLDQGHTCSPPTEVDLPPYTSDCRMKRCPNPECRQIVEWADACSHIYCISCGHEFCFICLVEGHEGHDCPMYDDPPYDENGRDARGLDVRTGLDPDGFDRLGRHADGRTREAARLLEAPWDLENDDWPQMRARMQELLLREETDDITIEEVIELVILQIDLQDAGQLNPAPGDDFDEHPRAAENMDMELARGLNDANLGELRPEIDRERAFPPQFDPRRFRVFMHEIGRISDEEARNLVRQAFVSVQADTALDLAYVFPEETPEMAFLQDRLHHRIKIEAIRHLATEELRPLTASELHEMEFWERGLRYMENLLVSRFGFQPAAEENETDASEDEVDPMLRMEEFAREFAENSPEIDEHRARVAGLEANLLAEQDPFNHLRQEALDFELWARVIFEREDVEGDAAMDARVSLSRWNASHPSYRSIASPKQNDVPESQRGLTWFSILDQDEATIDDLIPSWLASGKLVPWRPSSGGHYAHDPTYGLDIIDRKEFASAMGKMRDVHLEEESEQGLGSPYRSEYQTSEVILSALQMELF